MSGEQTAIKTAYETLGMTPKEIAIDRELDEAAVKACLMNCSAKYRKACGLEAEEEDRLNFSDDELERVNQVILEAALCATHPDGSIDWKTRSQNAQYIRDDKKGRKDVKKLMQGNTFNILTFNEQMKGLREKTAQVINGMLPQGKQT